MSTIRVVDKKYHEKLMMATARAILAKLLRLGYNASDIDSCSVKTGSTSFLDCDIAIDLYSYNPDKVKTLRHYYTTEDNPYNLPAGKMGYDLTRLKFTMYRQGSGWVSLN